MRQQIAADPDDEPSAGNAAPAQGEPQPGIANDFASLECVLQDANEAALGGDALIAALRAENERQARERSDMSIDIEKYRNEIAKLKSERDAAQRAGVTTANYWMERAELAEDQRERTRDVWATRAERAEAECEKLRELLRKVLHATSPNMSMDMYAKVCAAIDAAREGK